MLAIAERGGVEGRGVCYPHIFLTLIRGENRGTARGSDRSEPRYPMPPAARRTHSKSSLYCGDGMCDGESLGDQNESNAALYFRKVVGRTGDRCMRGVASPPLGSLALALTQSTGHARLIGRTGDRARVCREVVRSTSLSAARTPSRGCPAPFLAVCGASTDAVVSKSAREPQLLG